MRGCGTRGQMQTDERPHIAVLRAAMDQSAVSDWGTLHFWENTKDPSQGPV